jgi:hypothetical protein
MTYIIIFIVIIAGLTFWLPYRRGKRALAFIVPILLTILFGAILIPTEGIFFEILLIPIGLFTLIFIVYWGLANSGFGKKAARIAAIIFSVIAILVLLSIVFEDSLFFKSNAKALLKENNISIHDDFKIISNNTSGMRDFYQKFELQISDNDKIRIIEQIRRAGYSNDTTIQEHSLLSESDDKLTKRIFKDSEEPDFVRLESYEERQSGYIPGKDVITVSKTTNTLTFERTIN